MSDDLKKLVLQAQKGEKEAFGEIYKLYFQRIYRFVYFLTYEKILAEDITQNTFLKAWKALPKFDVNKGTIQAYLFEIARNLVTDFRRKKKEIALGAYEEVLQSKENLDEQLESIYRKDVVSKALKTLNDDEKQIIILRFFEELTFTEIAKVVRKNEGALRVGIHRILKKLKENMDQIYGN